jgi:hypothetical protein
LNQKFKVENRHAFPVTLWLEPWGADYTMLPGDLFEVLAEGVAEDFYLHLGFKEKYLLLWVEGKFSDLSITQDGNPLECGHNRQNISK